MQQEMIPIEDTTKLSHLHGIGDTIVLSLALSFALPM